MPKERVELDLAGGDACAARTGRRGWGRSGWSFTLIEIMVVVFLLALLTMLVVPQFNDVSEDAREVSLGDILRTMRSQINLYRAEHNGRSPHLDENGQEATNQLVDRLTMRTDPTGKLDSNGPLGPYLTVWPANPYCPQSVARDVTFGPAEPARDGTSGWYFNTETLLISSNARSGS